MAGNGQVFVYKICITSESRGKRRSPFEINYSKSSSYGKRQDIKVTLAKYGRTHSYDLKFSPLR